MTKRTVKNKINKILSESSKGLYSDQYWIGVNAVWSALRKNGYFPTIESAEYNHDTEGKPVSKTWKFSITFEGKYTFFGVLTAHGAGSVDDPLDRYDISAYCS